MCDLRSIAERLFAALAIATLASASAIAAPMGTTGPPNVPAPRNSTVAPDAPVVVGGKRVGLKTYMGRPLVVWQIATWSPTCKAGLRTFARHQADIDKSDMTVLILRDYQNGGYPGPSVRKLIEQTAPTLLNDPHFVIASDTRALFSLYNPGAFVDVYQVIAPDRHIAIISSMPSATFGNLESFIKPRNGA